MNLLNAKPIVISLFIRIACKHSMPGRHVLNISTGTKSGSCAGHDDHSDSMIFGHFAAKFLISLLTSRLAMALRCPGLLRVAIATGPSRETFRNELITSEGSRVG